MHITMVKKLSEDGTACKKCQEVEEKMQAADQMRHIDQVVIACENDPRSEGMILSAMYGVERAPFFVVERDGEEAEIYTVYLKFVKEVLNEQPDQKEELAQLVEDNPDLDFL